MHRFNNSKTGRLRGKGRKKNYPTINFPFQFALGTSGDAKSGLPAKVALLLSLRRGLDNLTLIKTIRRELPKLG